MKPSAREHLDRSQAVLLDLDGTIYHDEHPLPGAMELIGRLIAARRTFACISNSTSSPARVAERLTNMGAAIDASNIFTAGAAAVDYALSTFPPRPRVFNLGTEGVHEMLEGRADWVDSADQKCDIVIVGAPSNVYVTEARQRIALQLLRAGARLVGCCADRVYPSTRGIEFGSGAHTNYLAYAANVTPVFTGKPNRIFFEELCKHLNTAPVDCVLIGDNLESDIGGGKAMGMRTILTLCGITRRGDAEKLPAELQPDAVVEDLRELL